MMDDLDEVGLRQRARAFQHRAGNLDGVEREAPGRAPDLQLTGCDLVREFDPDLRLKVCGNCADNLVEQLSFAVRARLARGEEYVSDLAKEFAALLSGVLFGEFDEKCEVARAVGHERLRGIAGR
jgi:hypothetical protein